MKEVIVYGYLGGTFLLVIWWGLTYFLMKDERLREELLEYQWYVPFWPLLVITRPFVVWYLKKNGKM